METMVPLEIGVSLTSKIRYDKVQNNEAMNVSLDLLKTKWDDSQAYQKGWKNIQLEDSQGGFVLKKVFVTNKEMSLNSLGQK